MLFSEPKIPQIRRSTNDNPRLEFQCSSASRKFLKNKDVSQFIWLEFEFQCSSASRKFLKLFST